MVVMVADTSSSGGSGGGGGQGGAMALELKTRGLVPDKVEHERTQENSTHTRRERNSEVKNQNNNANTV
jgi:hypothetical protein